MTVNAFSGCTPSESIQSSDARVTSCARSWRSEESKRDLFSSQCIFNRSITISFEATVFRSPKIFAARDFICPHTRALKNPILNGLFSRLRTFTANRWGDRDKSLRSKMTDLTLPEFPQVDVALSCQ